MTFSFRTGENFFEEENPETPQSTLEMVAAEDSATAGMSTLTLVLSPVPVENNLVVIDCTAETSPQAINASYDLHPTPRKKGRKRMREESEESLEVS